jgi:nucleotide-binding universal stress UspA family protein
MFRRILVPLDGTPWAEPAIHHAIQLATPGGDAVHLLRILPAARLAPCDPPVDPQGWRLARLDAESYLERLVRGLGDLPFPMSTEVGEGSPCEEIVRVLRRDACGLIVLLDHAPGRTSGLLLGSTAGAVLLSARTSVLLLPPVAAAPPLQREPYREVLIPLDGSARGEWVLDRATELARVWGARLVLVHILTPPDILRMQMGQAAPDEHGWDTMLGLSRTWARRYLDATIERLAPTGIAVECHLVEDATGVAPALEGLAHARGSDLIMLSARGAGGGDGWPYGSVATRMLLASSKPVLVMQPGEDVSVERPLRGLLREGGGNVG